MNLAKEADTRDTSDKGLEKFADKIFRQMEEYQDKDEIELNTRGLKTIRDSPSAHEAPAYKDFHGYLQFLKEGRIDSLKKQRQEYAKEIIELKKSKNPRKTKENLWYKHEFAQDGNILPLYIIGFVLIVLMSINLFVSNNLTGFSINEQTNSELINPILLIITFIGIGLIIYLSNRKLK